MIFKTLILSAAISLATLSSPGAEEFRSAPTAVIELFTSQGCSSCPAADALLSELSDRDDIVALAYHVDYWDYIGWQDTFGRPENSDYQRAYAAARGVKRIYTPQLIINGALDIVGSRRQPIETALDTASLPLPVNLIYADNMLGVEIAGNINLDEAKLWLVSFKKAARVKIERGENRARTLDYSHIVTDRRVLGMWEPGRGASFKLPLSDVFSDSSDGAAIIVQTDINGMPGPILGAASFSH